LKRPAAIRESEITNSIAPIQTKGVENPARIADTVMAVIATL
jgi:hypothetical protein